MPITETSCSYSKCGTVNSPEANPLVNVPGKNRFDSQLGAHELSERNKSLQDIKLQDNPRGLELTTSAAERTFKNVSFNSLKPLSIHSTNSILVIAFWLCRRTIEFRVFLKMLC